MKSYVWHSPQGIATMFSLQKEGYMAVSKSIKLLKTRNYSVSMDLVTHRMIPWDFLATMFTAVSIVAMPDSLSLQQLCYLLLFI